MTFKDNLLKKIEIDNLAQTVIDSWGPPGSGHRIDASAMRRLIENAPYVYRRQRDLDLYLKEADGEPLLILVLDNELKIYRTTIEDVVMRKSPLIKEMVSIRNAVKILRDTDVVVSQKAQSVATVHQDAISTLDLAYTAADLDQIAAEGSASLENGYAEGVIEALTLFAELLNFKPAPEPFHLRHHQSFGVLLKNPSGTVSFGPSVGYSLAHNRLLFVEDQLDSGNKGHITRWQELVSAEQPAAIADRQVFDALRQLVMRTAPPSSFP